MFEYRYKGRFISEDCADRISRTLRELHEGDPDTGDSNDYPQHVPVGRVA
jgi:hypothetical protein